MNRNLIILASVIGALILLSLIVGIATPLAFVEAFRVVFGSVYVLFLPGFLVTWVIFPRQSRERHHVAGGIDWLERVALSFALSIAIVPLIVFYLNLVGLKISTLLSFLTVTVINLVAFGLIYWRFKSGR